MKRRTALLSLIASVLASKTIHARETLGFSEFYVTGTEPTTRLSGLNGHDVTISGYMAPPLRAESDFFVLTRTPMAVCPFCDSELDWPSDIVLVKCDELVEVTPFNRRIVVDGKLAVGFEKDAATGFVSFVRLMHARYQLA
jgi:hypothetical protein